MKVSVSLPPGDVVFVDAYAQAQGFSSRSAVVHQAIELLRNRDIGDEYEAAWAEWIASEDAELWDSTISDGLG